MKTSVKLSESKIINYRKELTLISSFKQFSARFKYCKLVGILRFKLKAWAIWPTPLPVRPHLARFNFCNPLGNLPSGPVVWAAPRGEKYWCIREKDDGLQFERSKNGLTNDVQRAKHYICDNNEWYNGATKHKNTHITFINHTYPELILQSLRTNLSPLCLLLCCLINLWYVARHSYWQLMLMTVCVQNP